MNDFRTVIKPEPFAKKLSYHTPALFLGSCFSNEIGGKAESLKFPVIINPSGVLYNPVSVLKTLERILEERPFVKEELNVENGLWFSFMHDTSFSDTDPDVCLEQINRHYLEATEQLKKARFLFLTFGTAWVYELKENGGVVANCHKLPAARFRRRMLEVEEIVDRYGRLTGRLLADNPDLQIVFTVSPIRHWKDGAEGNQYSKSVLHVAIRKLMEKDSRLLYFPSYEIMMDDLRDYRFYATDMLHLSEVAVDYIWERFREALIDPEALPVMEEVHKILQAMAHRPYRPASENHRKFRQAQLQKIHDLEKRYPYLDLSVEKKYFSQ